MCKLPALLLREDWISIKKDSVPPHKRRVVVLNERTGNISVGYIDSATMSRPAAGGQGFIDYKWEIIGDHLDYVTHWMPLPEKYKEDV